MQRDCVVEGAISACTLHVLDASKVRQERKGREDRAVGEAIEGAGESGQTVGESKASA